MLAELYPSKHHRISAFSAFQVSVHASLRSRAHCVPGSHSCGPSWWTIPRRAALTPGKEYEAIQFPVLERVPLRSPGLRGWRIWNDDMGVRNDCVKRGKNQKSS